MSSSTEKGLIIVGCLSFCYVYLKTVICCCLLRTFQKLTANELPYMSIRQEQILSKLLLSLFWQNIPSFPILEGSLDDKDIAKVIGSVTFGKYSEVKLIRIIHSYLGWMWSAVVVSYFLFSNTDSGLRMSIIHKYWRHVKGLSSNLLRSMGTRFTLLFLCSKLVCGSKSRV